MSYTAKPDPRQGLALDLFYEMRFLEGPGTPLYELYYVEYAELVSLTGYAYTFTVPKLIELNGIRSEDYYARYARLPESLEKHILYGLYVHTAQHKHRLQEINPINKKQKKEVDPVEVMKTWSELKRHRLVYKEHNL